MYQLLLRSTYFIDCKDAYDRGQTTDGVYTINPDNQTAFQVYCDMTTDGGGWTMLQRRFDGSVNFNHNWTTCEKGFGNLTGEHWLGLINMHRLTASAIQGLRVDVEDFRRNTGYAYYGNFSVGNATTKYLLIASCYSGTAGDSLTYHSGSKFTTFDQNNDGNPVNCALVNLSGPWWYRHCHHSTLNGKYFNYRTFAGSGIHWYSFRREYASLYSFFGGPAFHCPPDAGANTLRGAAAFAVDTV